MQRSLLRKGQRVSRACDFCHGRGLRCRPARERSIPPPDATVNCLTCIDYGVKCTLKRPVRRRGRKPSIIKSNIPTTSQLEGDDPGFKSMHVISRLIRIYRDTMYQCYFPFLPESELLSRWVDGVPASDEPSYMLLMALCAVSCQSAALNAVFNSALLEGLSIPDSEQYFSEAVAKVPLRITASQELDYMRSFGLLAVYSLQRSNNNDLHRYLGLYHTLVAQHSFHNESRWPRELSPSDVDDRRRLFWCVYRLEIHSVCVLGHVVRLPESQVSVQYPRITPSMDLEVRIWTAGWDYVTDLFRLLEYAVFGLHGCKSRKASFAAFHDRPSPTTLTDSLARLKAGKPRMLLDLIEIDSTYESDRCSYMVVQIMSAETLITIMTLLYCQAPACEVMEVAEDFLREVTKVPLIMFKVAGSHFVHQLLGVGHMLFNTSRYDNGRYQQEVKGLIAFLGDWVKNLQHEIPSAAAAGERLRSLAEATSSA